MTHWSAADAAELDCLLLELVNSYFDHREACDACQRRLRCPAFSRAIEIVLEWRHRRILLSRAEALRAERDESEAAA